MTAIKLSTPIEFDGKRYEVIQVGEPTVGGVEAFQLSAKGVEDAAAVLAGTIAMLSFDNNIPTDALRRMKMSDMQRISEALAPFLEALNADYGTTGGLSPRT